jgi:hypothetical protein
VRYETRINELRANSLLEALSRAQGWMKENAPSDLCWFRGIKDAALPLMPGAYWRTNYSELETLLQFSQEGRAFVDIGEVDDWKTYYLAQHSGVPTRLLDWTENFITALFFATDGWSGATTPCVWIIQPSCVNQLSIGWSGLISPERNDELNGWMPTQIAAGSQKITSKDGKWVYDSANPIALYPRKNNSRLVAQQGTFTVHGAQRIPLDSWIIEKAPMKHQGLICKIVFSRKVRPDTIMSELADLGLRRSTIYPDLQNFVLEMKENHGWQ